MPLIEGIGDEVTFGLGFLALVILVLVAWVSTHTREIPLISVIVVELTQRRNRNRNNSSPDNIANNDLGSNDSISQNVDGGGASSVQESEATEVGVAHQESLVSVAEATQDCDAQKASKKFLGNVIEDGNKEYRVTDLLSTVDSVQNTAEVVQRETSTVHSRDASSDPVSPSSSDQFCRKRVAYFQDEKERPHNLESIVGNADYGEGPSSLRLLHSSENVSEVSSANKATPPATEKRPADVVPAEGRYEIVETSSNVDSDANTDAEGQQIRVRLKYLNDTQRLVYSHPEETIGNFRRAHFSSELEENKLVRFIFNGQDLRNDLSTLQACNIGDNSVIHCLITQNRRQEEMQNVHAGMDEEDSPIGAFVYPVFGLILGLVWYLRFSYKQYFNLMSTISLAGVSFIYILALISSLQARRPAHHPHVD